MKGPNTEVTVLTRRSRVHRPSNGSRVFLSVPSVFSVFSVFSVPSVVERVNS